MRILSLIIMLVMMTIMASAQNRGGEVIRKPNTDNMNTRRQSSVQKRNPSNSFKGINRNIDGLVLAKSTKQDVINLMKKNNLRYIKKENGDCLEASGEYNYGGVSWSTIEYRFHNNILWQVVFSKTGSGPSGSTIVFDYSNLKESLLRKYKEYYSPVFADDLSFSDNATYIAVFGGRPEVNQKLQLRYTDANILKIINGNGF